METRPGIKLQLSLIDKIADKSGNCIIFFMWILALVAFFKMPDTIPTHFNASGQADSYGSKGTIFILPIIATIIFIVLTILNRHPHIFNYMNTITKDNAVHEYTLASRTIRFLKLIVALLFTIIVLFTFLTSLHITNGLGSWFLSVFEVLIFIPTIYAVVIHFRNKNAKSQQA